MVKKIRVEQLRPGMFIHDLNCSWLNHPFFGSSLKLKNQQMIEKIIGFGIREVYIDTDKGIDVADDVQSQRSVETLPGPLPEKKNDLLHRVPIEEEILKARKIKQRTIHAIQQIMTNIKLGKQIEKTKAEEIVKNILGSVFRNQDALIGLGRLRKINDYVYNHSMSVCVMCVAFGKSLGFDDNLLRELGIGAVLHDIGTTRIPPDILNKTTALSDEEFDVVKQHVEFGRAIIEQNKDISYTSVVTACEHHERIDGSGYPKGLKGDEITPFGQIIAIVDVYDALTTKRCYKTRIQPTSALRILYEWSGVHFNKDLVEKFIRCIGIYPAGSFVRLESGLLGVVIDHNEDDLLQPIVRVVYNARKAQHITIPYDIALADLNDNRGSDRIIGHESPDEWEIHPEVYL